ncbi:MAG: PHP domain-containing protein, partial [Deltaproteobacteria bacterium]|nr:PHP domain-containing protein [Deltaproteobacteria bacterium]
ELLAELSPGLLQMLELTGLGTKKVRLLYNSQGIDSIEKLEANLASGKVQELPGMGEKSAAKITKSIENYRILKKTSDRFGVAKARKIALEAQKYLLTSALLDKVQIVGSLRRWQETIGNIDIIATTKKSTEPLKVINFFHDYQSIKKILTSSETKTTVLLTSEIKVTLRILAKDSFGSALLYYTGSKGHNLWLSRRAKQGGLRLEKSGLFDGKTNERINANTEEEIFTTLGLEFTPPELRQVSPESGEALYSREIKKGIKPLRLIETSDILGDLHMHSTYSDGSARIIEMAEAARLRGYSYVAITDHSRAVGIAHGLSEKRLLIQIQEIDELNKRYKEEGIDFRILKGTEVDILASGALDFPPSVLENLDCVIGAVHSGLDMPIEVMTNRVVSAIETGLINILAHPTGRIINRRLPYAIDIGAVMSAAKKHRVALELNSYPDRLDLKDTFCRQAKEAGVLVAVSTDSHSVLGLGNMAYGIGTARRGGLGKEDIINTLTLEKLLGFLNRD